MGVDHFSAHFQMPTQNFGYTPFFLLKQSQLLTPSLKIRTLPFQHEAKLHPDVVTYNSIIAACERCGIWAKALELVNLMEEAVGFSGGGMYKRLSHIDPETETEAEFEIFTSLGGRKVYNPVIVLESYNQISCEIW